MANITSIQIEYSRNHQPEQYGGERATISGSATIEEGEDAFAIADAFIGRAKAVCYRRLGLKATPECGAADLAVRQQMARQLEAATLPAAEGLAVLQAAEAETAGEPASKPRGRPPGSGKGTRQTRAQKAEAAKAEAEAGDLDDIRATLAESEALLPGAASNVVALPGTPSTVPLPGGPDEAPAHPHPADAENDDAALMALLGSSEAAPAVPEALPEIGNAEFSTAIATAAANKQGPAVMAFLKARGKDRVLALDQAERRQLLAQLAK